MSILGYCLLPFVVLAVLSVIKIASGVVGNFLTIIAVNWATISASRLIEQYM